IWHIKEDADGKATVEFLANLKRHTKAVNVCRFSPNGDTLATAGDDSVIIFWHLSDNMSSAGNIFQEDEEDNLENWCMQKVLRGHLEDIYDICWSSDGKYMVSGSVDNSAILWDLTKDQKMCLLNEHKSFVQGVAWDPRNEFVATLSTDRSCRIYNISNKTCVSTVKKMALPTSANALQTTETDDKDSRPRSFRMFHDDTMRSFFRRLTFSPDGELLIIPAGLVETEPVTNATFIFTRNCLTKPAVYLPSPEKVTIAARCCPTKFQLRTLTSFCHIDEEQKENLNELGMLESLFFLPYRLVFAVATEDSILMYDTQQPQPFGCITNVHYHQLSDLTWSTDGQMLVASSTDGYCTLVSFSPGELGTPYTEDLTLGSTISDKQHTAVDMESSSDLHLILDTSTDGSGSDIDNNKSSESVQSSIPVPIAVKSKDGKPRNIQITTLSSVPSQSGCDRQPDIMVRSADGKPKNVQFTTLATFSSPTSSKESVKLVSTPDSVVLKEKRRNLSDGNSVSTDECFVQSGKLLSTPKSSGSSTNKHNETTPKSAAKRVQLTTIQLFENSSSLKHSPKKT
ncbi:hypothetical protein DPMN_053926, partial [Dreissena polymorpha]